MKRSVFYLSDRTAITTEVLGHSLITQFDEVVFEQFTLPFIDSQQKAADAVEQIDRAAERDGNTPLVFSTLLNDELRATIQQSQGVLIDFFETYISPLEKELGIPSAHAVGRSHGIGVYASYKSRIDAVNYALNSDDGVSTRHYPEADLILVGVSRSGKTPTCLYMALQYGVMAANYPITEEDMEQPSLPKSLHPYRKKLFGLTIEARKLQQIRNERLPDSRYASLDQCEYEIMIAEEMFRRERIPYLNTSSVSIEEITSTILHAAGMNRNLYASSTS